MRGINFFEISVNGIWVSKALATVDGSEILHHLRLVGFSHHLKGFLHPKWCRRKTLDRPGNVCYVLVLPCVCICRKFLSYFYVHSTKSNWSSKNVILSSHHSNAIFTHLCNFQLDFKNKAGCPWCQAWLKITLGCTVSASRSFFPDAPAFQQLIHLIAIEI